MRLLTLSSGIAAGADGAGTANQTSSMAVCGEVYAIGITYNDSPPATTDVTIATAGTNALAVTLLTVTSANTNAWFYPRAVMQTTAGATVTFDGTNEIYGKLAIADYVKVTIAEASASDSVTVHLLVD